MQIRVFKRSTILYPVFFGKNFVEHLYAGDNLDEVRRAIKKYGHTYFVGPWKLPGTSVIILTKPNGAFLETTTAAKLPRLSGDVFFYSSPSGNWLLSLKSAGNSDVRPIKVKDKSGLPEGSRFMAWPLRKIGGIADRVFVPFGEPIFIGLPDGTATEGVPTI